MVVGVGFGCRHLGLGSGGAGRSHGAARDRRLRYHASASAGRSRGRRGRRGRPDGGADPGRRGRAPDARVLDGVEPHVVDLAGGSAGSVRGLHMRREAVRAVGRERPPLPPEEGVLYLGGEPYELEWVCCPLPVPRGPGGQPGGASPAPELHRSLLLRPQKWGASVMWVVFGGNAMLASDWYPFCNQLCRLQGRRGGASAAFLLFDFPGYGGNPGRTSPAATLTASLCSLRAALARFDAGPPEVNLLGHSLGAAAAAQLAAHLAITGAPAGRLVLSAPFTSIPHVAVHLLQRAAGFVWQRAAPPRLRRPCSATARTDLSRRLGRPPAGFWSRGLPRSRPTAGATSRPCVRPPARAGRWASSTARRTCWCRPAWAASFTTRRARPPSTLPPVGGSAAPRGSCCSMGGPPQRRRLRRRVRSVASWRCPERTTATRCCSAPPVVQSSWASCEVAGSARWLIQVLLRSCSHLDFPRPHIQLPWLLRHPCL
ncbi:unnamed protein product [Prorocentrum cordatum]|uniref:AB hydrolase-1 domain-containing protein n=1 Tax=Prorocentrum cordatum TaxID=2364126 RepID=A0ABN9QMQ5_9DINO|nr:unnamed protein product [Polarella glacialis]